MRNKKMPAGNMHKTIKSTIKSTLRPKASTPDKSNSGLSSVIVARQPVFANDLTIWGYEVLFRSVHGNNPDQLDDFDDIVATRSVLSDGLGLITPSLSEKQRLLVNFPAPLLEDRTAKLLSPETGVVEILETVQPTRKVLTAVAELKADGYMIALDDFVGQRELLPFIPYVDLVKVEVLGLDYRQLQIIVQKIMSIKKVRLLAEKIEDKETLENCKGLGFTLFQGYYFARPELKHGKKINPSEMAKVRLISMLNDPDFKINEVSKIVQSDAALSLKLFRYLNSSAVGLNTRVESVERGLSILGSERLIQWLTATVLSQLASDNLSSQVALNAALAGFFLSALVKIKNTDLHDIGLTSDGSFLFGLLISLKPLLGDSFNELVGNMPIQTSIIEALLHDEGPYTVWIPLLNGYERNNLTAIQDFCQTYLISEQRVNETYFRSSAIVHAMFDKQD
ncbi:HDOD domain-containing protein [Candidatus Haliotispira prima]|uniref:HDOD domain-containing protein n=1 Tax=Candidatus Haliotispira prima TaxID=3034016 RepID=A0ABY8MFD4_9SPIO|nr:HDOD domain-containing protein [Candidatus Haliotispira prima]